MTETAPPPRVSVLMSVYNGERFVREAVASILNQTLRDFEFLIVDDGSTDKTGWALAELASLDARIQVIRNEKNLGLTRSLNRAWSQSRGEFIARQDADDVSLPDRFQTQAEVLFRREGIGLLGTAYRNINQAGERFETICPPAEDAAIRWTMLFHNAFCHTSVMFRRAAAPEGPGLYDERFACSQDYDLWARIMERTRAANLEKPLVLFRRHGQSVAATRGEEQRAAASEISHRLISALAPGLHLTPQHAGRLRQWYWKLPAGAGKAEMREARAYFDLLDAYARHTGAGIEVMRELRQECVERLIQSIPRQRFGGLVASGLLGRMLRNAPGLVLSHLTRRLFRKRI